MATSKTFTIDIQMSAAQQALTDTSKKLDALDKQLQGLDRESEAAKNIVAEMAKLAKQAEQAEAELGQLGGRLDALKPGSLGALRLEVEELEAALELTVKGTEEQAEAIRRLGEAKGSIKEIEDAVDALDPKQKAAAFVDFGNGVVGAFGVATVAAETFGLSSQSVEQYQKKLLGAITVLDSVEQISKAVNSETLSVVKSSLAAGKAYLFGAESASTASKITRAALISTGIGAIVVLVGLLAANFDKVKAIGASIYAKFKPQFEAISGLIDTVINRARDLASVVTFGLVDDAAKHAIAVAKETAAALAVITNESRARRIAVLDAEGRDTIGLKARQLAAELRLLKTGSEEEKKAFFDKYNELLVLEAQFHKRQKEQALAADLARLNAQLAQQTAKGLDGYTLQQQIKQRELQGLLEAETRNGAAIITKRGEIEALRLAHQKEAADKRLAAEFEAFKKRVVETERLEYTQEGARRARAAIEANARKAEAALARIQAQQAAEDAERAITAAIPPLSFTDNMLVRVFGVAPAQLENTKARITAAAVAVNAAVSQYYAGAQAEADARLQEASNRLSLVSQALDQNRQKQATDEAALQNATGARRDYLLAKLAKERQEEEKLNAAKNRAAQDEKKRLKEQQQLQKESQRVALALTAATAIRAAVDAIASAAAIPFPANIPAIITAGATVASGVFAAKALGNSFADGGFITGPGGPRADEVPTWLSNGEFVVNAEATAKNRGLLEAMNASANRVLPPGTAQLAAGTSGGASEAGGGSSAELAQLLAANQELIGLTRQLVGHAQTTAEKPALTIGPGEALAIEQQRLSAVNAEAAAVL